MFSRNREAAIAEQKDPQIVCDHGSPLDAVPDGAFEDSDPRPRLLPDEGNESARRLKTQTASRRHIRGAPGVEFIDAAPAFVFADASGPNNPIKTKSMGGRRTQVTQEDLVGTC